jgi:malonyl-CoA O-methyltransferase
MKVTSQLAQHFSVAAEQYEKHACVQAEIAQALFTFMAKSINRSDGSSASAGKTVLDLGCATALNASRLCEFGERYVGVDISEGMLKYAANKLYSLKNSKNMHLYLGDAQALPLQNDSVDLVFSSMALQWCDKPATVITEINRVLKPGGQAFLAIMLGSSMHELHDAWAQLGLPSRVNEFADAQTWLEASSKGENSTDCYHEFSCFTEWHINSLSMLKGLKAIGANTKQISTETKSMHQTSHEMITRSELRALDERMVSTAKGYPLSYEIVFLHLNNGNHHEQTANQLHDPVCTEGNR